MSAEALADLHDKLARGLHELGIALPTGSVVRLLDYVTLLEKWNRTYSLTAVREPAQVVSSHLLDSLAVAKHLLPCRLLDVGTGPGLPGIPLAVLWPHVLFTLLDSNRKKTAFVRQAAAQLELENIEVVCERVETWKPEERFDTVISRAFSAIGEFALRTRHTLAPGGVLAAMKGVYPRAELKALPQGVRVREVVELHVPGLNAERHLVLMDCA